MWRLGLFTLVLVAVFAAAALAGGALDPSAPGGDDDRHAEARSDEHGGGGHAGERSQGGALPGLALEQAGFRLQLARTRFAAGGGEQRVEFQIVDDRARPVRDFEVEHAKRMHFIVVRRDLRGFQHLHPTLRPDGTWAQDVRFERGGSYRVFADFTRNGTQRTLGADVQVAGEFRPQRLPSPGHTARSDGGLDVTLRAGETRPGREGRIAFDVRDGGRLVNDRLEPYLGAAGHLVALRQGDLAYLHTHPEGDELAFMTTFPSAGAYRLFVQFRYEGRVHTAAFTRVAPR